MAKALKAFNAVSGKRWKKGSTDPYHARLWTVGDAIGEACWLKGHAAGIRRKAPAEGKIRVDLSLTELLQLSWLAQLGFQHMMPNYVASKSCFSGQERRGRRGGRRQIEALFGEERPFADLGPVQKRQKRSALVAGHAEAAGLRERSRKASHCKSHDYRRGRRQNRRIRLNFRAISFYGCIRRRLHAQDRPIAQSRLPCYRLADFAQQSPGTVPAFDRRRRAAGSPGPDVVPQPGGPLVRGRKPAGTWLPATAFQKTVRVPCSKSLGNRRLDHLHRDSEHRAKR